jgi:hypothetical protein
MGDDLDTMTYMMAAEKMINLIFTIEQTMAFMDEYKVKCDEEVKKALEPLIKQMSEWIK